MYQEEACCFVANHQGYFDILAILAAINKPMGFIAKKGNEKYPYTFKVDEKH